MITIQHYIRAQSLEQAYELNQNRRNRILAQNLSFSELKAEALWDSEYVSVV